MAILCLYLVKLKLTFANLSRFADLTLGSVTKNIVLVKGYTRESEVGPLVWNLIMNVLFCNISEFQNCHKIAFANDLLLIV